MAPKRHLPLTVWVGDGRLPVSQHKTGEDWVNVPIHLTLTTKALQPNQAEMYKVGPDTPNHKYPVAHQCQGEMSPQGDAPHLKSPRVVTMIMPLITPAWPQFPSGCYVGVKEVSHAP